MGLFGTRDVLPYLCPATAPYTLTNDTSYSSRHEESMELCSEFPVSQIAPLSPKSYGLTILVTDLGIAIKSSNFKAEIHLGVEGRERCSEFTADKSKASISISLRFTNQVTAVSFSPDGTKFAVLQKNLIFVFKAPGRRRQFNPFEV